MYSLVGVAVVAAAAPAIALTSTAPKKKKPMRAHNGRVRWPTQSVGHAAVAGVLARHDVAANRSDSTPDGKRTRRAKKGEANDNDN